MSDKTPNSSDNLNGSEPSMEDILASIRKIISDDEPVALESPEDLTADDSLLDSVLDIAKKANSDVSPVDVSAPEGESVDLNIDEVLADLDKEALALEPEMVSTADALDVPESEMVDDDDFSNVLDDILSDEANIDEASDDSLDLLDTPPETEDDILSLLDDEILLEEETASAVIPELVSDAPSEAPVEAAELTAAMDSVEDANVETLVSHEPDDIDALLNGLLGDDEPLPIEEAIESVELDVEDVALGVEDVELEVEDVALGVEDVQLDIEDVELGVDETSLEDLADTSAPQSGVEETEDLALVKSLMADLSDDPTAIDAIDTDEDLESLLAIPDAEDLAAETAAADPNDDILDEILDMTLEDELQTHPEDLDVAQALSEAAEPESLTSLEDVMEAELENIAENAQIADEEIDELAALEGLVETDEAASADDFISLTEIAEAAEADAIAVEAGVDLPLASGVSAGPLAATAGAVAGALVGIKAATASDETPDVNQTVSKAEPVEILTEQTPEPLPNQENEMPVKAVQTDAILDDVTESATAGAFAELNQIVEDKAVFNERGPRIGDLVQDALRPMLKEWLDSNLKGIVERAVTKEVKRISSGK